MVEVWILASICGVLALVALGLAISNRVLLKQLGMKNSDLENSFMELSTKKLAEIRSLNAADLSRVQDQHARELEQIRTQMASVSSYLQSRQQALSTILQSAREAREQAASLIDLQSNHSKIDAVTLSTRTAASLQGMMGFFTTAGDLQQRQYLNPAELQILDRVTHSLSGLFRSIDLSAEQPALATLRSYEDLMVATKDLDDILGTAPANSPVLPAGSSPSATQANPKS